MRQGRYLQEDAKQDKPILHVKVFYVWFLQKFCDHHARIGEGEPLKVASM